MSVRVETDAEFVDGARLEGLLKARGAIKKSGLNLGKIDCPVCDGKGALHFSVASSNGHVHARCTTDNCVRWME